jgi:DNA-binding protein YbaB
MKTFNIDDARKHHEFLYLLQEHKKDMEQFMQQLSNMEKELTDGDDPTEVESDEEIGDEGENETLQDYSFQETDRKFKKIYEKLAQKMWNARLSGDPAVTVEMRQTCASIGLLGKKQQIIMDSPSCTIQYKKVIILW